MQAGAIGGVADVHAGALPDRLQTFKLLDAVFVVVMLAVRIFRFVVHGVSCRELLASRQFCFASRRNRRHAACLIFLASVAADAASSFKPAAPCHLRHARTRRYLCMFAIFSRWIKSASA
jgi:hypothetical protein